MTDAEHERIEHNGLTLTQCGRGHLVWAAPFQVWCPLCAADEEENNDQDDLASADATR